MVSSDVVITFAWAISLLDRLLCRHFGTGMNCRKLRLIPVVALTVGDGFPVSAETTEISIESTQCVACGSISTTSPTVTSVSCSAGS